MPKLIEEIVVAEVCLALAHVDHVRQCSQPRSDLYLRLFGDCRHETNGRAPQSSLGTALRRCLSEPQSPEQAKQWLEIVLRESRCVSYSAPQSKQLACPPPQAGQSGPQLTDCCSYAECGQSPNEHRSAPVEEVEANSKNKYE